MSAGKQQYIARRSTDAPHNPVGPLSHLLRRLAVRAAVTENLPTRTFGKDVGSPAAFVLSVVPFNKIRINGSGRRKAG